MAGFQVGDALTTPVSGGSAGGSMQFAPGAIKVTITGNLSAAALAQLLGGESGWDYVALFTASPGTTGANECSGAGYVRVAHGGLTVSGGYLQNTGTVTVFVPAGQTATHAGLCSTSS